MSTRSSLARFEFRAAWISALSLDECVHGDAFTFRSSGLVWLELLRGFLCLKTHFSSNSIVFDCFPVACGEAMLSGVLRASLRSGFSLSYE